MRKFDDVPQPEYEAEPDKVLAIYLKAWKKVIATIYKLSQLPQSSNQLAMIRLQNMILQELTVTFRDLRNDLGVEIEPHIREAYFEGASYSNLALDETIAAITEAKKMTKLTETQNIAVDSMVEKATSDLLKATNNTEQKVKNIVRTSFASAFQDASTNFSRNNQLAKKVMDELTKTRLAAKLEEAEIAIVDRAGRQWNTRTYINMATKTHTFNAYMQGIIDQAERGGADLAIISTKPDTTDACLHYEGMIISMTGKTPGYKSYWELRRSKQVFHPNCGHFCRPVQIDLVPKKYLNIHEKKMQRQSNV